MSPELARQAAPGRETESGTDGAPGRKAGAAAGGLVLQVIGLQRSGNHAIIDWISSLFASPVHLNNLEHDFGRDPANVADNPAFDGADCRIVSFEDARIKLAKTADGAWRPLMDSVETLDPAALAGFDCRILYILRDPYNCWASRVKAREASGLTSPGSLDYFLDSWTAMARRCLADPEAFVLYNAWFDDRAYRQRVCARLGGTYSERTLGEVPLEGGGSSFDGAGRPSLRTMAKKLDYYRSADFRRRFLRQPGSYVRRLLSPSIDGRQLKVDSRWQHLAGRDDARALFEDETVRRLSQEIFGFHVDGAGRLKRNG